MHAWVHLHDVACKISRSVVELVLELISVFVQGVVAIVFLETLVKARRSELQLKLLDFVQLLDAWHRAPDPLGEHLWLGIPLIFVDFRPAASARYDSVFVNVVEPASVLKKKRVVFDFWSLCDFVASVGNLEILGGSTAWITDVRVSESSEIIVIFIV